MRSRVLNVYEIYKRSNCSRVSFSGTFVSVFFCLNSEMSWKIPSSVSLSPWRNIRRSVIRDISCNGAVWRLRFSRRFWQAYFQGVPHLHLDSLGVVSSVITSRFSPLLTRWLHTKTTLEKLWYESVSWQFPQPTLPVKASSRSCLIPLNFTRRNASCASSYSWIVTIPSCPLHEKLIFHRNISPLFSSDTDIRCHSMHQSAHVGIGLKYSSHLAYVPHRNSSSGTTRFHAPSSRYSDTIFSPEWEFVFIKIVHFHFVVKFLSARSKTRRMYF